MRKLAGDHRRTMMAPLMSEELLQLLDRMALTGRVSARGRMHSCMAMAGDEMDQRNGSSDLSPCWYRIKHVRAQERDGRKWPGPSTSFSLVWYEVTLYYCCQVIAER